MNGLCGILRLDNQAVDYQQLQKSAYSSPKWQPDQHDIFIQNSIGFTSTQRFITPECAHAPMPYHHAESKCTIVADVYLSNRSELIAKLKVEKNLADAELILAAYLKWGHDCPKYLAGPFMFAIWDDRIQELFITVDHFGNHPGLYSYQPGKYFVFANYMSAIRNLSGHLTTNENLFAHFVLDSLPNEETCYQEVKRILPGHYLVINKHRLISQRYWQLKDQKHALGYKTREEYYQAFREIFTNTTQNYLRSAYPITAHISGGLDSSAVAAMAAKLLQEKNQSLFGFTAIPLELEGPSYRDDWFYHEMPRVQEVLRQYPNIQHSIYRTDPTLDPFAALSYLNADIDQPIRNIFNFEWIIASLEQAAQYNSRIVLHGQKGNATISWTGTGLKTRLGVIYRSMKSWLKPKDLFHGYYHKHHLDFLKTPATKKIMRENAISLDVHYWMLTESGGPSRQTSIKPFMLHSGVLKLDPTADVKLTEFCYNVPQWVYYKGKDTLQRRLLVREALTGIVPEAICMNPNRGEQAADAYLQYNLYANQWKSTLQELSQETKNLLWKFYDKEKILALFSEYETITAPTREIILQVYCNLIRCISAGLYLEYLTHGKSYDAIASSLINPRTCK